MKKKRQFSKYQLMKIRQYYAKKSLYPVSKNNRSIVLRGKYPFWAKMVIGGDHPSLIIDSCIAKDKRKNNKLVPGFLYRESTHSNGNGYEKIYPNPDPTDFRPMYLKRPQKKPKTLFVAWKKKMNMPQGLIDRYNKNNRK